MRRSTSHDDQNPSRLLSTDNVTWLVTLLVLAVLIGHVSYEVFLATNGSHFDKYIAQNLHIWSGHADMYGFQQRMLPSYIIQTLADVLHIDFAAANYMYYRYMFVATDIAFILLCMAGNRGMAESALYLCSFSVTNILVIASGYWLMAYDVQNELFVILLFTLYIARVPAHVKWPSYLILFAMWQFTFEEVVYIPMIYLVAINKDDVLTRRVKSIFLRRNNWLLGGVILGSQFVTNYARAFFNKGDSFATARPFFGEWIMIPENLQSLRAQLSAVAHPLNSLTEGYYWVQGATIFCLLVVCAFCLLRKNRVQEDTECFAVVVMFFIMGGISFVFAHLEETNTLLPMVAALFAIHITQKRTETQCE